MLCSLTSRARMDVTASDEFVISDFLCLTSRARMDVTRVSINWRNPPVGLTPRSRVWMLLSKLDSSIGADGTPLHALQCDLSVFYNRGKGIGPAYIFIRNIKTLLNSKKSLKKCYFLDFYFAQCLLCEIISIL